MVPKGCARTRSHLLVLGNSDNMHVYGLLLLVRIHGLFVCHHESLCHVRAVRATNPHRDRPNVMKRRYQIPLPNPSVSRRQLKTLRAPNAYEGNSSPNSSRPKDRNSLPLFAITSASHFSISAPSRSTFCSSIAANSSNFPTATSMGTSA